jgi:hypothetical protein
MKAAAGGAGDGADTRPKRDRRLACGARWGAICYVDVELDSWTRQSLWHRYS